MTGPENFGERLRSIEVHLIDQHRINAELAPEEVVDPDSAIGKPIVMAPMNPDWVEKILPAKLLQESRDPKFEGTPPSELWGEEVGELCDQFIEFAEGKRFLGSVALLDFGEGESAEHPKYPPVRRRLFDYYSKAARREWDRQKNILEMQPGESEEEHTRRLKSYESHLKTVTVQSDPNPKSGSPQEKTRVYGIYGEAVPAADEFMSPMFYYWWGQYIGNTDRFSAIQKTKDNPNFSTLGYPIATLKYVGLYPPHKIVPRVRPSDDIFRGNIFLCSDGTLRYRTEYFNTRRHNKVTMPTKLVGARLTSIPYQLRIAEGSESMVKKVLEDTAVMIVNAGLEKS